MLTTTAKYEFIDSFPGWSKATVLLKRLISERGIRSAADIGGGANPLLDEAFVTEAGIDYALMDISQTELDKAPSYYSKLCVDISAPAACFGAQTGDKRFDLVFSHMFMEHLQEPLQAHRNVFSALNPGGLAVHFFPSPCNVPLTVNRVFPETLTRALVKIAQPARDIDGNQGKFPAYYRMCGNPSATIREQLEAIGYRVVQHTGYIGHYYYERIPFVQRLEIALRPLLLRCNIPLTSAILLVLERPR